MECMYSVEVTNKFAFDIDEDEDDDPIEILKRQEAKSKQEKEAKKNEKPPKKDAAPAKKAIASKKDLAVVDKAPTIEAVAARKEDRNRRPPRMSNDSEQERNKANAENRGPPSRRPDRDRGERGADRVNREDREGSGFHRDNRDRDGISSRYRGNRGGPRQDRGPREDRPPREDKDGFIGGPREGVEGVPSEERERGEGGGYGRGRGSRSYVRGGRGRGIPSGRPPRHEFERRSGSDRTGVKAVEKKEGGGAHNWGTVQDDVMVGDQSLNDTGASAEEVNQDWASQVEAENQSSGPAENSTDAAAEEEAKQMTLDEYRTIQSKQRVQAKAFNVRKANEGVENPQWKKMVVLAKPKASEGESDEEYEEEEEEEHQPQKNVLNIEFRFSDSPRRGGRGRKGGPGGRSSEDRRGGYRGGERGTRGRNAAPNVNDERDFPSLVKTS